MILRYLNLDCIIIDNISRNQIFEVQFLRRKCDKKGLQQVGFELTTLTTLQSSIT